MCLIRLSTLYEGFIMESEGMFPRGPLPECGVGRGVWGFKQLRKRSRWNRSPLGVGPRGCVGRSGSRGLQQPWL